MFFNINMTGTILFVAQATLLTISTRWYSASA